MENKRFERLLQEVPGLTREQRLKLKQALQDNDPPEAILDLVATQEPPGCPDCGESNFVKSGHKDGLQRYRCNACKRSFNGLTQTAFSRLRYREKWLAALECVQNQDSLSQMQAKLGICRDTACRWRKRILQGLAEQGNPNLDGIVEADETVIRCSEKGCRKLERPARKRGQNKGRPGRDTGKHEMVICIARDRNRNTAYQVVPSLNTQALVTLLDPIVSDDSILCTDGLPSFSAYTRLRGLAHVRLRGCLKERTKQGVYHIQNVNNYHSRLKRWMRKFNGVATRYLGNYLAWFRYHANISEHLLPKDPLFLFKSLVLTI